MINALIGKTNKIFIDPTIQIVANSKTTIKFDFQIPWSSKYELYAVFKPVFDVAVKVKLDTNNECEIPKLNYNKYNKLGIALYGEGTDNDTICSSYQYLTIIKSPCN